MEAEALFNLGRMERLNGKIDSSIDNLQKSLELDETINNANPSIIKATVAEIAKSYYEKEDYEKGIPYLERLLDFDKKVKSSGQANRFIVRLLSNYSVKLKEIGEINKTEKYQRYVEQHEIQ